MLLTTPIAAAANAGYARPVPDSAAPAAESNGPVPPVPEPAPARPLPEKPPGEAFAVALMTGQLLPRPTSERELERRLAGADVPADTPQSLTSRLA